MAARPPVIVIGMSRSGTTILMRMLEELGLFVGRKKTRNNEAIFFQQLNKWLLAQCSGGLDNPTSIKYLLKDEEVRVFFTDFIRYIMKTSSVISFLGWGKYLRYRTPANLDIPWGWKDPRNTYTLPIWLDIFPDAKVIHIRRHGLDVVNSLRARRKRGLSRLKERQAKLRLLYWFYSRLKLIPRQGGLELRCVSLEDGLAMWEEYIQQARTHLNELKDRAVEVKYEDLLAKPHTVLRHLADFCELRATDRDIERVAPQVKKERAYAYRDDPELAAFTTKVAERLRIYGY